MEVRTLHVMVAPEHLTKWPGIKQILEVEAMVWKPGKRHILFSTALQYGPS
jgi:hypothetical protein